jgi:hypothetical protein
MGEVISLAEYRNGLSARSIVSRLLELGHDALSVRKTVATLLVEKGRSMTMAELWVAALGRLDPKRTRGCAPKLAKARPRSPHGAVRPKLTVVKCAR